MSRVMQERLWYTRREGTVRGPYSADHISRYILLGRIRLGDELSMDGQGWQPVTRYPDIVPAAIRELSSWDDYQHLVMARMRVDERRAERRQEGRAQGLPPGALERRQGRDRRRVDRDLQSFATHLMAEGRLYSRRRESLPLRTLLLATLLATLVAAWFSIAFR